jgi:hypothetical protein
MKTEFKASFLRSVKRIRDAEIKKSIADVIIVVESADQISKLPSIKKI